MSEAYTPPVSRLLELGYAWNQSHDYREEFGISGVDIPELRRLLFDETFYEVDEDDVQGWGYIHATYALGQLREIAALKILIQATLKLTEHEGFWDIVGNVMGQIGPAGLPLLATAFRQHRQDFISSAPFITAIGKIGQTEEDGGTQAIQTLTELLKEHSRNSAEMNGHIIAELLDLGAVETAPIMKQAFQAEHVDPMIAGDWDTVQIELGLKPPREDRDVFLNRIFSNPTLPIVRDELANMEPLGKDRSLSRAPKSSADKARKKKQKAEKQARKKNRKKK